MSDHTTLQSSSLKVCTVCGEAKSPSEFHKFRNGMRPSCKACTNAQNRAIYQKNHDAHLEAKRRYRRENPAARRETVRSYDKRHGPERKAHAAVKHEINMGRLPRASECDCCECGQPASIYHHHSYDREHWLDVKPMCRVCHGKEHQAQ